MRRDRKWKATATTARPIQRKLKLNRRKSASVVKTEIENELGISLHSDVIRKRAHESRLFGRVAPRKLYANKGSRLKRLRFAKKMFKKPVIGEGLSDLTNQNLIFSAAIEKLWSGERSAKSLNPTTRYQQ